MKVIEIVVTPEGKATVQTKGFHGASCREASRFLEQAMGSRIKEQVTVEFHQLEPVQQTQHQKP
jgi:hypothetical protein